MSATMARQRGRVQLEQSDILLALDIAKMAKGGFSHAITEETDFRIKIPRGEVRAEKKRGVQFPRHKQVKPAIERQQGMLHQTHTARCHPCQHGTAKNPQTRWRHNGTGAPPPDRPRQPTPEPMLPLPETPHAPTGNNSGAQPSQIVNLLARYAYSHTSQPCDEFFTLDASALDCKHDTDFDPDMLTDEGTSTG